MEKKPTNCLKSEFRKKLKEALGYSPAKEVTEMVNMPVVGNIIKLISLAF